jgi:tRNA A-37 threonylcarbamoyl transferase component Bud32
MTRLVTTREGQDGPGQPAAEQSQTRGSVMATGVLVGGKFRIESRIARGGQASVYLARQEPLNRPVALKILSPPTYEATDEEREAFEQRFLLEARTLAELDHPNIVTIFDYGETEDGRYYLAMEYITGGRFLDLLKKGHLEPGRAVSLVTQVAQALRYSHKRGVVHRDVKNSNVLVRTLDNGEEQAKVVDFGLVKLSKMDSGLTQTGMILGSPHFMAPEQATGQGVDHRADIYATGVLLYCGLTGKYPFDGPHATAIITAHVTRDVPTFATVAPSVVVPEGLEVIVRRCLEKKPSRRYPSMDALIAELAPFHPGSGLEAMSGEFHTLTAGTRVLPKTKDWTMVWVGAVVGSIVAILLAMLVGTAYLGFQMRQTEVPDEPSTTAVVPAPQQVAPPPVAAPAPVVPAPVVPAPVAAVPPAVAKPVRSKTAPPRARPQRTRKAASRPVPAPIPTRAPDPAPEVSPAPSGGDWGDEDIEAGSDPWE